MARLVEALVMPPLSLLLLAAAGLVLARRRKRLGLSVTAAAASLLVLLMLPLTAAALLRSLQRDPHLEPGELRAEAIVVLAADHERHAPEYGGGTIGAMTLERVRYAATLARRTGLPILVSGGIPRRGLPPLSEMMDQVLAQELGVQPRWLESASANTRENARNSAEILSAAGVHRIALVTHAWHMPRAKEAFERAGMEVLPAPTSFRGWPDMDVWAFLPSAKALRESTWACHEWIGRAWYALAG